jgi:hypothetical protein
LGSPLACFSPNTEISFFDDFSEILFDTSPVFLLVFSPLETADLLIYYSLQVMDILYCVTKKAASAAQRPYGIPYSGTWEKLIHEKNQK